VKTDLPLRHRLIPFVLQTIAWFFPSWPLSKFFLHFKTRGVENVDRAFALAKERGVGVLFCPNHLSEFDPILILQGMRPLSKAFPMFYVIYSPSSYKDRALFGWRAFLYGEIFFLSWGAHALNVGKKDYAVALEPHVPILNAGHPLTIFPEGTTSKDGTLQPARGGAGYLIMKTRPIVVPIRISGLEMMRGSDFWFRRRHALVVYGNPILPEEVITESMREDNPDDCKAVSVAVFDRVKNLPIA